MVDLGFYKITPVILIQPTRYATTSADINGKETSKSSSILILFGMLFCTVNV